MSLESSTSLKCSHKMRYAPENHNHYEMKIVSLLSNKVRWLLRAGNFVIQDQIFFLDELIHRRLKYLCLILPDLTVIKFSNVELNSFCRAC